MAINERKAASGVAWMIRAARALRVCALAAMVCVLITACSSPEERVDKYYESGVEYFEKDEIGRANVQFRNALKINDEHVPTLKMLAEISERRQDFRAMFGLLQRIVRLDPLELDARVRLGQLLLLGNDDVAALDEAEAVLAVDEDHIAALALKSAIQLKIGDSIGAVEIANRVLKEDPGNAEASTVLATERTRAGDNEAALAIFDKAIKARPDTAVLQLLRINVLDALGRKEDVYAGFQRLIESFPDDISYRRAFANILVNQDELGLARTEFEAIAALEPDNFNAKIDVIRIIKAQEGAGAAEQKLREYIRNEPKNFDLKFALSDFLVAESNINEAIEQLHEISSMGEPVISTRAKDRLATLYISQNNREAAQKEVAQILAVDKHNTNALIKKAGFLIDDEKYDNAIVELRTALSFEPEASDAILLMAMAFDRQGDSGLAQAEFAKAFDVSGKDARVANAFANFLVRIGRHARAEEVLTQSLAVQPRNIENLQMLAGVRLYRQDWRGAEEIAELLDGFADAQGAAASERIRTASYSGQQDYARLIDLLSNSREDGPLASRPLATLVSAYVRAGRLDEAETTLRAVLSSDSDNDAARVLFARIKLLRDDEAGAEAILNNVTQTAPNNAQAYELLYRIYVKNERLDDARAIIAKGLAAAPQLDVLRILKADLHLTEQNYEGAFAIYEQLLEKRPNDKFIANNFVSISSDLKRDETSVRRALDVANVIADEENPLFQDTVGWAYLRAGEIDEALQYLSRAAGGAGGNAEVLYHYGAALLAAGQSDKARETLQKALDLKDGDFRYEREVRDLLEGG